MTHVRVVGGGKQPDSPLKVLALTRYERLGASSRVRMLQYVPALRRVGIDVQVSSLLDDRYVRALYARGGRWRGVVTGYARRCRVMHQAAHYDVVWLEKECLPWVPSVIEIGLLASRCRLVVDYDDAWFHRYDRHSSRLARCVLAGKIDAVMRRADLVTVGNDYLAERARSAGARRVEALPTVVDLAHYRPAARPRRDGTTVVGWIGSPSTASYLRVVAPVLADLRRRHDVRCVAIGARPDQVADTPFEAVSWSESSEVRLIQGFDIGIMPLLDNPFERGKCGYKLLQYMACGLPVVASPVGINCKIVSSGVNGFLADGAEAWASALEQLVSDDALRYRMGVAGRRLVGQWYSLDVQVPRVVEFLRSVAAG